MYVCLTVCRCVCVCVCVCVRACVYVYICGVCMYKGVYSCKFISWVACCSVLDPFMRSGPIAGDPNWCSLWSRYTSDSKINP